MVERERGEGKSARIVAQKTVFFPSKRNASSFRARSPAAKATNAAMPSSADRINLGELTAQLANAEARVCEWAAAAGKRADAARIEHGRRIAALRGEILKLNLRVLPRFLFEFCLFKSLRVNVTVAGKRSTWEKKKNEEERRNALKLARRCMLDERRRKTSTSSSSRLQLFQKNTKTKTETVSRLEAKRDEVARRAGELRTREYSAFFLVFLSPSLSLLLVLSLHSPSPLPLPSPSKQKKTKINIPSELADQAALEQGASLEASEAEREASLSEPLVQQATRELAEAERELSGARARLCEASGGRKRRLGALRAALSLYERTLGLRFVLPRAAEGAEEEDGNDDEERQQQQQSREELKIVFSQVDARDPSREFSLGLHCSSSSSSSSSDGGERGSGTRSSFSVLRCEPPACLGALRRLCDALNSSPGEFGWFVREVRAEFRARAADEGGLGGGVGRMGV